MSPSSVLKLPVHGECTFCESGANEILLDGDKRTSIIHVCLRIRTHKTDYFPAENKKRMLSFHWIRCQHSQGHVFAVNWRQDSFPQGLLTLSPTFLRRFFPCHFEFLSSLFKVRLWSNSWYPFFCIFVHDRSFLVILPNLNPLRTLQRASLDLYFPEFSAAINFPCSNSWLKIGVNDVIFSKIPHGLNL